MKIFLATFPIAVVKYIDKNNLREEMCYFSILFEVIVHQDGESGQLHP